MIIVNKHINAGLMTGISYAIKQMPTVAVGIC